MKIYLALSSIFIALLFASCSGPKIKPVAVKQALVHYEAEVQSQKDLKSACNLFIEASDIQLPLTGTTDEPQDERYYSFFVWVNSALVDEKPLSQLLTNELSVEVLGTKAEIRAVTYGGTDTNFPFLQSRREIEVRVNSKDISQSFEIVAWFPKEYQAFRTAQIAAITNANASIRNLSFELRAAEKRKSKDEVTSFKNEIAEQRSYLQMLLKQGNPFGQRKRVRVYNGDLRVQILTASHPEIANAFGPAFAKYFHVGRIFLRNTRSDKQLVVYTTSIRANAVFYRPPDTELAKVLADTPISNRLDYLASQTANAAVPQRQTAAGLSRHYGINLAAEVMNHSVTTPVDVIVSKIPPPKGTNSLAQFQEATNMVAQIQGSLQAAYARVLRSPAIMSSREATTRMENYIKEKSPNWLLKLADSSDPVDRSIGTEAVKQITPAEDLLAPFYMAGNPMAFVREIPVNASGAPLAFSADARQQATFAAHGFIWRDYYRPMTFATVLNSLIETTDSSWRSQAVKYLRTAGIIAGGLVGLGPVVKELSSEGYITSVAVATSVFLPEAQSLLAPDLTKYIKNLGDLAFDTVVVVPPNGSIDKYVFFPTGPIFYGVDEFNVSDPAFIVQIDGTDVAVQAMLIDKSQTIEAGQKTADQLVQSALNLGQSVRNADDAKLVSMTDSLRKFRLTMLPNEIKQLIHQGNTNGALHLISSFEKLFGDDKSGVLDKIKAETGLAYTNETFSLAPLPDLTLSENSASPIIKLVIQNPGRLTLDSTLSLQATNTDLLPANSMTTFGTNAERSFQIRPANDQYGDSRVTVTLTSGAFTKSTSFNLTVLPTPRVELSETNISVALGGTTNLVLKTHSLPPPVEVTWSADPTNIVARVDLSTTYTNLVLTTTTNAGTAQVYLKFTAAGSRTNASTTISVRNRSNP